MIVYTQRPGAAPERLDNPPPWARDAHDLLVVNGLRAIWVMVDEGVIEQPPPPSCYGSRGE